MKNFSCLFRLIILISAFAGLHLSAGTPEKELRVFRKFSDKLHSVKTISYHYTREFTYPAEGYHSKSEGNMYIGFSKENDSAEFRYQHKDQNRFSVFNNSEFFETSEDNKGIHINQRMKLQILKACPLYTIR